MFFSDFLFYLHEKFKFWIELFDLSDSLKYFIPSEPILFPFNYFIFIKIRRKNQLFKIFYFCFCFIYFQYSSFGLNCWIWVIHLNISFLLSQFYFLFFIKINRYLSFQIELNFRFYPKDSNFGLKKWNW